MIKTQRQLIYGSNFYVSDVTLDWIRQLMSNVQQDYSGKWTQSKNCTNLQCMLCSTLTEKTEQKKSKKGGKE